MKRKYWSHKEILAHAPDYAVVLGGRNLGKSYDIKRLCLTNSWKRKTVSFVLIRRFDLETKPSLIESYFADSDVIAITDGKYNCISAYGGTIYFSTLNMENGKITRGVACGKYFSLAGAIHIKSTAYPDVTDFIFEEFCATEYLGENEPDMLQQAVSTVARSRHITAWLIGNTVNRMNPYIRKWGLHIEKCKEGTITDFYRDTIDADGNPAKTKISVELCKSEGAANSMFFGTVSTSINNGAWECNEHPRLEYPKEVYTVLYDCLLMYSGFSFVLQLLCNDETGKLTLFAYPYTNKHKKYERILKTEYSENPFVSVWFDSDNIIEAEILRLLDNQQIAFSDNLTGDECIQALKGLKSSTL